MTVGELETVRAEGVEEGGSAGVSPPPPRPGPIRWAEALQSGAVVAAVAGVLVGLGAVVPGLTGLGILLVLAGALLTLALYRRRVPGAPMSGAIGARIGLATGLLVIAAMGVVLAGTGVWARYRTGAMAQFDGEWTAQMAMLLARTREMAAAQGPGGAEAAAEVARMVGRPEFRAWTTLLGFGGMGLVLLGVLTASGAMAGSVRERRRP